MSKFIKASLAVVIAICTGSHAFAIGGANIGNEVPSARAAGQGYTGVAGQNDDPTTVYSNPAGMTNLKGTQVTLGAHYENIHPSYESPAGVTTRANVTDVAVPNFSMTQSFLGGALSAGFSTQSPFGLETSWGEGPLRYVATNSRLRIVEVIPAVAFKAHKMISFGAGVKYVNAFDAQLDRHVNTDAVNIALGSPTTGAADTKSSLEGQAADWGYHFGVMVEPHEKHAFGVTYHSKVDLRLNGNVTLRDMSGAMATLFGGTNYTTSAYTDIVLPRNVQMGYAYKHSDKWLFEADAAWYNWTAGKDLRVRYAETNTNRLSVLNTGNPSTFNLRDVWSFATGFNYKASDNWQFRGGVWYEPWAMPESTFNPAFADLSRYGISTGAGLRLTKHLTLDAAYTALFFHNRHINNNVGTSASGVTDTLVGLGYTDPDISGTYKNFANIFALNLTYRFGQ